MDLATSITNIKSNVDVLEYQDYDLGNLSRVIHMYVAHDKYFLDNNLDILRRPH